MDEMAEKQTVVQESSSDVQPGSENVSDCPPPDVNTLKPDVPEDMNNTEDHTQEEITVKEEPGENALPVDEEMVAPSESVPAAEIGEIQHVTVKEEPPEVSPDVPVQNNVEETDDCIMMEYRTSGNQDNENGKDSSDSSPDSDEEVQQNETADKKINKMFSADRDASPERKVKMNKHGLEDIRTKGEFQIEDLPPVEDLKITVDENTEVISVGKVSSIVGSLAVVEQTNPRIPALDIDTILLAEGRKIIGQIFEVLGPVVKPWYTIRFNGKEDIQEKGISVGMPIYYAPKENNLTKYVLVSQVQQMKGSDASWKDNNETPAKFLDFSDDEEEKRAKNKRKGKKIGNNNVNDEASPAQKNKNNWEGQSKKPHITQWPPRDPSPRRTGGPNNMNQHQGQGQYRSQGQQLQNMTRHQSPQWRQPAPSTGATQSPRWRPNSNMQFGGPPRFNNGTSNFNTSPAPGSSPNDKSSPGFINNSRQFGPPGNGQNNSGQFVQNNSGQFGQKNSGQFGQNNSGQFGQNNSGQFGQNNSGQFGQNNSGQFNPFGNGGGNQFGQQSGGGQFGQSAPGNQSGFGQFGQRGGQGDGGQFNMTGNGQAGSGHIPSGGSNQFGQGTQNQMGLSNNLSKTCNSGPQNQNPVSNNPQQQIANFFQTGQYTRPPPNFQPPSNMTTNTPLQHPLHYSTNTPPPNNKMDNIFGGPKQQSQGGNYPGQQQQQNLNMFSPTTKFPGQTLNNISVPPPQTGMQQNIQTGVKPGFVMDTRYIQNTD